MLEQQVEFTSEIIASQSKYLASFNSVLTSRGLQEEVNDSIFAANCVPFLQAKCDDEDGAILLPPSLETLLKDVHQVNDWSSDTPSYIVGEVRLGSFGGTITVETPLTALYDEFVLKLPDRQRKVTRDLNFDVDSAQYFFGVRISEGPERQIVHSTQEVHIEDKSIVWETHPLTAVLINDLADLIKYVNEDRANSEIRIRKNPLEAEAEAL